jgi:hypothetical protein
MAVIVLLSIQNPKSEARNPKQIETLKSEIQKSKSIVACFENTEVEGLGHFKQNPSIASFQHGVLEPRLGWMFPEASLRT